MEMRRGDLSPRDKESLKEQMSEIEGRNKPGVVDLKGIQIAPGGERKRGEGLKPVKEKIQLPGDLAPAQHGRLRDEKRSITEPVLLEKKVVVLNVHPLKKIIPKEKKGDEDNGERQEMFLG